MTLISLFIWILLQLEKVNTLQEDKAQLVPDGKAGMDQRKHLEVIHTLMNLTSLMAKITGFQELPLLQTLTHHKCLNQPWEWILMALQLEAFMSQKIIIWEY